MDGIQKGYGTNKEVTQAWNTTMGLVGKLLSLITDNLDTIL